MTESIILNANIVFTIGYKRGLLINLHQGDFHLVPNSLILFLQEYNKVDLGTIYKEHKVEDHKILDEYISWLIERNMLFIATNNDLKNINSNKNKSWDFQNAISNCILEINELDIDFSLKQIREISKNRIPYLEIRIFGIITLEELKLIISEIQGSNIKNVSIFAKFFQELSRVNIKTNLKFSTVIGKLIIYDSPRNMTFKIHNDLTPVIFIKETIQTLSCGKIDEKYYTSNHNFYNESRNSNSCLNRKISIDKNGEIRNCPGMGDSYGNIQDTTLQEALEKKGFKDKWAITKDKITVCKDCEFRDICSDCRAYLQDPHNIYSKPLKCGYDPYTNIWEEWSTNPLSKKGIEYYGMQDLVKDKSA